MAILELDGVCKEFASNDGRRVQALDGVTLSVGRGEFVAVVGPSGCGKSTLLRLAAGLDRPTSGTVVFEGHPVSDPSPERGMVFQSYTSFPWLTVRENIGFGLNDPRSTESVFRLNEWLDRTGLTDFADSFPNTLSGGMRQRLALARTMIVEPKLLLLDEPLGALDQRTREKLQMFLLEVVADTRCTAVLVTHDVREAVLLGDRVYVMSARPGRLLDLVVSDLPKPRTPHLIATPEFEAVYERVLALLPE